jgi:hypothetical protein
MHTYTFEFNKQYTSHYLQKLRSADMLYFIGHLFLIIIDVFCMLFWLVYMEAYADFLTHSFVFYISKHYHHHHSIGMLLKL